MQKHWAEAVYLVEEVVLMKRKNQIHKKRFDAVDVVVVVLLTLWMLLVIVPFVNAISISFATQKEYVDNAILFSITQNFTNINTVKC